MVFASRDARPSFRINVSKLSILLSTIVFLETSLIAQTPRPIPNSFSGNAKINYVRIWDALAPEVVPNTLMTRPLNEVRQTTQYFDGLGRSLQAVIKGGSVATGLDTVDLVSSIEYDQFGRETYKYIPFDANNTGGNNTIKEGKYK